MYPAVDAGACAIGAERMTTEILFNVEELPDGSLCARAFAQSIFVQADTVSELREQVRDAVACHFGGGDKPKLIRLHFVRDEVLAA
jgi:hypothetical protein